MVLKYSEYKKNKNYNSGKMDSCREMFKKWSFYLSIPSIYFHFHCMWWTKNIYLQRNEKSVTTTLDLLIIFIYPLLIWPNTLRRNLNFNRLPTHIKSVANEIQVFKSAIKRFLFLIYFIVWRNILILINNMYSRLFCFNVIINILLCNHIIIVLCNLTAVI